MKTVIAASIITFLLTAVSCFAGAQEFRGVTRLDLRVAEGTVKIAGVDGSVASVAVAKKRYDERCSLTVEQRGDLLFVELTAKSLYSARCEADFDLRLPRSMSLKLKTGTGDVRVADAAGPVDVETGTGEVIAEGLEAPAKVSTGTGKVRLVYAKVPGRGTAEISSGMGSAEVLFPKRAHVKTSFFSATGTITNRLGDFPLARFSVSMKTGMGNLVVGTL